MAIEYQVRALYSDGTCIAVGTGSTPPEAWDQVYAAVDDVRQQLVEALQNIQRAQARDVVMTAILDIRRARYEERTVETSPWRKA